MAPATRQIDVPFASNRPSLTSPFDRPAHAHRMTRQRQRDRIRRFHAGIAAEKPRHAIGGEQPCARAHAHREDRAVGKWRDEDVVDAWDALHTFDARSVYGGASEGREQTRPQVELRELQLRDGRPLRSRTPQREHRGIILCDERRSNPQRVEVAGGARRWLRRSGELLGQSFE